MVSETEIANKLDALNDLVEDLPTVKREKRQSYASAIARCKSWFMEYGIRITPVFADNVVIRYAVKKEDRCSI
jgi:hypothetical protein